jgi:hypothetical protein
MLHEDLKRLFTEKFLLEVLPCFAVTCIMVVGVMAVRAFSEGVAGTGIEVVFPAVVVDCFCPCFC